MNNNINYKQLEEQVSRSAKQLAPIMAAIASLQIGLTSPVYAAVDDTKADTAPAATASTVVDTPAPAASASKDSKAVDAKKFSDLTIKDIKLNKEDGSMLPTTQRPGAAFNAPKVKKPLDLGFTPLQVESQLSPEMKAILTEPKYYGSILIFVLVLDIMKNSASVQKKNRELIAQMKDMGLSDNTLVKTVVNDATALQGDAIALAKEVDDLKAELILAMNKAEFANTASSTASGVASDVEAGLKKEIDALKSELAIEKTKKIPVAPSPTRSYSMSGKKEPPTPSSTSTSTTASGMPKVTIDVLEREKKLVDAIKSFIVKEGYVADGVANMLMSASAPDLLNKISSGVQAKPSEAYEQEIVSLKKNIETMKGYESEMASLKKDMETLKSENSKLSTASASASASASGATQELKLQLASAEKKIGDLQKDTQNKMDSAKSMLVENASDLEAANSRIEKLTQALEIAMGRVKAAEANVANGSGNTIQTTKKLIKTPVASSTSTNTSGSGDRKSILKAMTQTQIKKMTKGVLEKELVGLGVSVDKKLTKDGLIALLNANL